MGAVNEIIGAVRDALNVGSDKEVRKADRAVQLAFNTASHASFMLSDEPMRLRPGATNPLNAFWPTFSAADTSPEMCFAWAAQILAPFVRANREAPPEALYIHARAKGVHDNKTPWAVLPLADAFAYALFVMVLNQTDTRLAEEAAEKARLAEIENAPSPRKPHADDHVMEQHDGMFDRVTLSKANPRKRKKTLSLPNKGHR